MALLPIIKEREGISNQLNISTIINIPAPLWCVYKC